MRRKVGAWLFITALVLGALILWFVRPPGPGQVYHVRSDDYGLSESTAILLRNGACLVVSRSEADIGRSAAQPGSRDRLFAIVGTRRIVSGEDGRGLYLRDLRTGLTARPGDAIDAEIQFRSRVQGLAQVARLGWPIDDRCAGGLAMILSISRVHR